MTDARAKQLADLRADAEAAPTFSVTLPRDTLLQVIGWAEETLATPDLRALFGQEVFGLEVRARLRDMSAPLPMPGPNRCDAPGCTARGVMCCRHCGEPLCAAHADQESKCIYRPGGPMRPEAQP